VKAAGFVEFMRFESSRVAIKFEILGLNSALGAQIQARRPPQSLPPCIAYKEKKIVCVRLVF
jgi:hypothetical protein